MTWEWALGLEAAVLSVLLALRWSWWRYGLNELFALPEPRVVIEERIVYVERPAPLPALPPRRFYSNDTNAQGGMSPEISAAADIGFYPSNAMLQRAGLLNNSQNLLGQQAPLTANQLANYQQQQNLTTGLSGLQNTLFPYIGGLNGQ